MVTAPAQNEFDEALARIAAKTPAGFSLRLTKVTGGPFVEGELVAVRLDYVRPPGPAQSQMLSPRYQFAGVLVEPLQRGCGSLERPCFQIAPGTNDAGAMLDFEGIRAPVAADLNTYTGHLPPGKYRIAAVMRKLVLANGSSFVYPKPIEYLVSTPIDVAVTPASAEWTRRAIEGARRELLKNAAEQSEARTRAARQIAAIDTPEARLAGIELYGITKDRTLLTGVARDLPAREGCELMRSRLGAREQVVDQHYVWQLAMLCSQAEAPLPPELESVGDADPRRQEWARRNGAAYQKATREGMAGIAARAVTADPHARELRATLAGYAAGLLAGGNDPLPEFLVPPARLWLDDLRSEEPWRLGGSLSGNWPLIHEIGGDAVLDFALARQGQEWLEVRRAALQLVCRSDPKRCRTALLNELRTFSNVLDASTSALLPAAAVPPMDDALLEYASGASRAGASPYLLIARYATPEASARVRQLYESLPEPCQPELLAYFLRADPPYAVKMLSRAAGGLHAPPSQCLMNYLSLTPPLYMSPVLENFLIAQLQHEHVPVKLTAVRQLGAFGSAAAEKPLWDSFLYFHEWWKNRVSELKRPGYQEGRILEQHLRGAIAHGQGWLTDESKLQRLGGLCLTTQCRADNNADLAAWRSKPLPLAVWTGPYGINGTIGQNQVFFGIEAVKRKLAQFPKATAFKLSIYGSFARDERARIEQELSTFAKSQGLLLQP